MEKLRKALPPLIVGAIQRRVQEGRDMHGNPFAAYSKKWRESLAAMGEADKVDLRLTGGLMGSLRLLRTERNSAQSITLVFGPDAGTSPHVVPPSQLAGQKARGQAWLDLKSDAEGKALGRAASAEKRASMLRAQERETAKYGVARNKAKAQRTGFRGPPHNLLGLWLHRGGKGRAARPWLALSPDQRKWLREKLYALGIFKS